MAATVVVAGMSELHSLLLRSGQFGGVEYAADVAGLVDAIRTPNISGLGPSELVFVLADPLEKGSSKLSLLDVVARLASRRYPVLIIPGARFSGADYSSVGDTVRVLVGDFTLNSVMFGLAAFGLPVTPVRWGYDEVSLEHSGRGVEAPGPAPAPEPAPEPAPASEPAPAPEPAPEVSFGWGAPASEPAPAPEPAPEPAPAPEVSFGWGAPASEPAPEPAPAPEASSGWGAPAFESPAPSEPPTDRLLPAAPSSDFAPPSIDAGGDAGPGLLPPAARPVAPVSRMGAADPALPPRGRRGFVITTAVSKGGTGKSSLTLNLAAFLGMRLRSQGKTVAIVDSNYQQADTGKYLDIFRPNITKLASEPALMNRARIKEVLVHKPELNLSALLGPATPDEANPYSIDARLYFDAVTLLREHYDYVLIDTPVAEKFHDLFQNFALPIADFIIVPVAPSFQTLHNADNWIRAAVVAPKHDNGAGIEPNRVGVVLNRAEEGVGCTEDDVRRTMAAWNFIGSIPETVEWKAANNNFEIIAKDNYVELNNAFSQVLYAATGEEILRESFAQPAPRKGVLDRIRRR